MLDDGTGIGQEEYQRWATDAGADACAQFTEPGGYVRSINKGMLVARQLGSDYIVAGNSDTLFAPHFDTGFLAALEGNHLVGPVSNCPGWGCAKQKVGRYIENYGVTDNYKMIKQVARKLQEQPASIALEPYLKEATEGGESIIITFPETVNGFTMCARTDDWFSGAYSEDTVFNPRHLMTGSEVELQARWRLIDRSIAVATRSFVFHYRSVARGVEELCDGWYRPEATDVTP